MAGDWDDSLKMLVNDNSQDFVTWLFVSHDTVGLGSAHHPGKPCFLQAT